ncbi:response regulator [Desulfogranum japonicum]|uniref:response regulator n=1 Tax=Desulfogranum japonicum TaxID=231447 RepID=UPI00041D76F3|nr:response regulator transcription factor [Desulfogranum japonicum]
MKNDTAIHLLLVDDHKLLLDSLSEAIGREKDLEVVGQADNGREALVLAEKLRPDVIVMDISMPELNGIEATRQIIRQIPKQKILTLSMHADKHYVMGMFRAGVAGYILKTNAFDELAFAIRQVHGGNFYVSPEITGVVVTSALEMTPEKAVAREGDLSSREMEILQLIAEGKNSEYMADTLHISKRTVEIHRQNLRKKLGLNTVAELTRYAVKIGIVSL